MFRFHPASSLLPTDKQTRTAFGKTSLSRTSESTLIPARTEKRETSLLFVLPHLQITAGKLSKRHLLDGYRRHPPNPSHSALIFIKAIHGEDLESNCIPYATPSGFLPLPLPCLESRRSQLSKCYHYCFLKLAITARWQPSLPCRYQFSSWYTIFAIRPYLSLAGTRWMPDGQCLL